MKKTAILALTTLLVGASCTKNNYTQVIKIQLNKTELVLYINESEKLEVFFTPNDATYKDVVWESSNKEIACVDNGLVTANKFGSCSITVTSVDGYYSSTCNVKVYIPDVPRDYTKQEKLKMFDASLADGIYNYCPSVIEEGNIRHVYYCTNKIYNNIVDYIGYRKGIKVKNEWYYSPEQIILTPTNNSWDAFHNCDPDVVKGVFSYKGEQYNYLMAYLGCTTTNNQDNSVGIAISKNPEGPWIKPIKEAFVPWKRDLNFPSTFQWGFGQPSLINLDGKGDILLFYSAGTTKDTCTLVERWDLSKIESPKPDANFVANANFSYLTDVKPRAIKLMQSYNTPSVSEAINNADFAYDKKNNKIYCIKDGYPFPNMNGGDHMDPQFISSHLKVLSIDCTVDEGKDISDFFINKSDRKWTVCTIIDSKKSQKPRNHNACIISDNYGQVLINNNLINIAYSISEVNKPANSLYTYRLYSDSFAIN